MTLKPLRPNPILNAKAIDEEEKQTAWNTMLV